MLLEKIEDPSISINDSVVAECVATLLSTDGLGPEEKARCELEASLKRLWPGHFQLKSATSGRSI